MCAVGFAVTQIFPAPTATAGTTILAAMTLGILPAETQIAGYGSGNNSIANLISTGQVNPSALFSTLTFASPNANYSGN
jgi:hypothetical protein